MQKLSLYDKTTLALDLAWMPMHFITKRRCFELLIRDKVDALDATYNRIQSHEDWFALPESRLFENLPAISSPSQIYRIPSIVILNDRFVKRHTIAPTKGIGKKELCDLFSNTCQICKNKFRASQLTVEHVYPRSKGGTNDDFNLTLTCVRCNNQKNDAERWLDADGNELTGISVADYTRAKFQVEHHRTEWEPFFIRKKK